MPVGLVEVVNGRVPYNDGVHVGYRAWLRSGATPAYPFGFGLGFTTWSLDALSAPTSVSAGDDVLVTATVTNSGTRPGRQVVQVYASRATSSVDRPVRWLAGFGDTTLDAGATGRVEISLSGREFAHFDSGWKWEPGTFTLAAGFDVANANVSCDIEIR